MRKAALYIFSIFFILNINPASASKSYHDHYAPSELANDAARYAKRLNEMFAAIKTLMTEEERKALQKVQLQFPMPRKGDYLINFYANPDPNRPTVYLPFLSLKAVEDMTTAYAWLIVNNYSMSTVDLYYTMLRYRDKSKFPGGKVPTILEAMGIPKDAYKDPRVGKLSLIFRNNAYAFILIHELGHIFFQHKGYDKISKKQARQDEIQSDLFALRLMERDQVNAPIGGLLFFQALAYNFTHRAEFKTEKEWEDYMFRRATHPLSTIRIKRMAEYAAKAADRSGQEKRGLWSYFARFSEGMQRILEDPDMQKCMKRIAQNAPVTIVKPSRENVPDLVTTQRYCRGIVK